METLVPIDEAARAVGLSPWTVRAMIRDGRIESVRLSRRRLIRRSEIERIIRDGLPGPKMRARSDTTPAGPLTAKAAPASARGREQCAAGASQKTRQ